MKRAEIFYSQVRTGSAEEGLLGMQVAAEVGCVSGFLPGKGSVISNFFMYIEVLV